ncbi:hypothetical protein FQZ97_1135680 [compost metagenome]
MVALPVVLHGELPVAVLDQIHLRGHLALVQAVRCQVGRHLRRHLLEVFRGIVGQADEDQARQGAHVHGLEAHFRGVEVGTHVLGVDQLAGQVVGPLVVGADDVAQLTLVALAQP